MFLDFGRMYEPVRKYTASDAELALRAAVKDLEERIKAIQPVRDESVEHLQRIRQAPWWDRTPFEWVDKVCWGGRYQRYDPLLRYLRALLAECQSAMADENRGRVFRHLSVYYNRLAWERGTGGWLFNFPHVMIWEDYNRCSALAKLLKNKDDGQDLAMADPEPLKFRVWDHPKPAHWWNIAAWIRRYPGVNLYVVFGEAVFGLRGPVWHEFILPFHALLMLWAYRKSLPKK